MTALLLVSAALMGLLGSTHCVLMCGGVVAMTCGGTGPQGERPRGRLTVLLAYNVGRVASYAIGGAIAGALGATLSSIGSLAGAQLGLRAVAGVLMILVGLYVAGLGQALRWVERAGGPLWRLVAPLARRLLPARTVASALGLGLLWGWMPCGLVYAALGGAATSGSALGGAATMAAFGLGTLPTLLAMGSLAGALERRARSGWLRLAAGVLLVAFGCFQLGHVGAAVAGGEGRHACCAPHAGG